MPNDEQGSGKSPYDVIASMAGTAVLKNECVYELAGGLTDSLSLSILGKDSAGKGIKISRNDDGLDLDIHIIVEFETKIPQLAWEIQAAVKEAVEAETEQHISAVNIHVQGVHLPGEEEEK